MKSFITQNLVSPDVSPVAFFCAEYAINSDESMYAGGLGILAGDFLFEAGDQNRPFVALGLKYTKTKTTENGFELLADDDGAPVLVEVPIGEGVSVKKIFLQTWVKRFSDKTFLFLLDSDIANNAQEDRVLGDLYVQNLPMRLKQEIYLGVGGYRLLKALDIKPKKYHLNEGSAALAAVAVLAEEFPDLSQNSDERLKSVRTKIVSTKHTILSVGTIVPVLDLWGTIGAYCEMHDINKELLVSFGAYRGDKTSFAMTRFLIELAGKSNGVSVAHTVFEKKKYPTESKLIAVTNGVYAPRWQSERWRSVGSVWAIKNELRKELVEEVNKISGVNLKPDVCTLIWSRRFVAYKRPLAIFADMMRLKNILLNTSMPLQIIISGKRAGTDADSIAMLEKVRAAAQDPVFEGKIVFIANDSVALEQKFVHGGDVWLNTPIRGFEACGTSGMKAGLNGALMASVSDGWMDEVDWNGMGWILADGDMEIANSIYDALEQQILPEFYARNADDVPEAWVERMKKTMNLVATDFSATRMLKTYDEKLYN